MSKYKTKLPQASRAGSSESRTDSSFCHIDSGGDNILIHPERKWKRKQDHHNLQYPYNETRETPRESREWAPKHQIRRPGNQQN